jgi:Tfp pilus assembly protein PilO
MSRRDRALLGVVALLAVLAAFWFVALSPKRAEVGRLDGELARAEQELAAATADSAQAERARADYARDYAAVARLGKAVPADDDVASLVYQLEMGARRSRVDLRAIKVEPAAAAAAPSAPATPGQPTPGAAPGGVSTLPLKVTFEGSFARMRRFLGGVRDLAAVTGDRVTVHGRLVTIDDVKLTEGSRGLPHLKAEVTATTYIAADPLRPTP